MTRSRLGLVVAFVCFALTVAVSGVSALRAQDQRNRAEAALISGRSRRDEARAALDRAVRDRRAVEAELSVRTAERAALTATLASTSTGLQATTLGLLGTRAETAASDRRARALADCLGGVTTAIHDLDTKGAIAALRAAQPACGDALTAGSTAAFPFDFPDPSILRVGGAWFAYSTNAGAGNVQVLASTDRHRWLIIGNALPATAPWAEHGATWAPVVIARPGGFALFYTGRDRQSGLQCISVATSTAPQGPFVDRSIRPLICQNDLGGSIDASPFVDADGQAWLTWKSEAPPMIWSRPLDLARLRLTGTATEILHATRAWERGNVEAPSFLRSSSGLVLAYSGNRWDTRQYAVGLATCATPAGPCEKRGDRPVLATVDGAVGPGGAELFLTDEGPAVAYAAYLGPDVGYPASRLLHIASFDPAAGTFGPG